MVVLVVKLKTNMAFRKYINYYWYFALVALLMVRIASVAWLLATDDLIDYVETAAVSLFLLTNLVTLIIWVRRIVMFRFEEDSDYYERVRTLSHVITGCGFAFLVVVQTIGIILEIFNYVHFTVEIVALLLNFIVTYKIIRSFKIFEYREVKKTIKWVYAISM